MKSNDRMDWLIAGIILAGLLFFLLAVPAVTAWGVITGQLDIETLEPTGAGVQTQEEIRMQKGFGGYQMATVKQVNDFIGRVAPIAQEKVAGRDKWSLPSVCIAQCCCESAYGTSPKMMNANAILGIKVGKSRVHFGTAWRDKAYSTKTKECYDGKTYVNITDMFRAYDSIDDAIEDYYDMLAVCSRYKGCLNQKDPRSCITAIKNGGYATSPTYVSTIMNIVSKYNLTRYDGIVTGAATPTGKYQVGRNYTLQANMYVRETPGGKKKKFLQLTTNAKSKGYDDGQGYGVLKKGTVVTCKGAESYGGGIWIRIPSGYICASESSGKVYVT